jgi:hypothetical protein
VLAYRQIPLWQVAAVDFRPGSQGPDADATNTHAMGGMTTGRKPHRQTCDEAYQGTQNQIAQDFNSGDLPKHSTRFKMRIHHRTIRLGSGTVGTLLITFRVWDIWRAIFSLQNQRWRRPRTPQPSS